ncbi:uncharacterized protein yc1106_01076 [Curvularia clavata]|uniref:Uncharacterized protein n=1 Tax=Curvularia clavata TaxID=95742 RepID=A0A9Q8Z152_CURCL|nr:uncharacterized protein yc1106_01076 [Curvularia clavata]
MSTSRQQSVPSQPPPPVADQSSTHRAGWPDMFVKMLEGFALRLDVGSNEDLRTFILPCSLLAQHSSHEEGPTENKARTKGADVVIKVESDTDGNEIRDEKERLRAHILLPDADPVVFGLFLHFIYQNAYPNNVDAVMPSVLRQQYSYHPPASNSVPQVPHQHPSVGLSGRTESAKHPHISLGTSSTTNLPGTSTTAQHGSEASTSAFNHKAADKPTLPPLAPRPPSIPSTFPSLTPNPTPPPPSNRQFVNTIGWLSTLPTSVHAHFLGYRLGACSFINYTLNRIHSAIGTSFSLTPGLISTIWYRTQLVPEAPLRRLILDYLVMYWSHSEPHKRALYIYPDERGWEMVFDSCKDVRDYLIRGMQNGVRVGSAEAYYITKQMMADSNWEKIGVVQQDGTSASAGPRTGPGPGAGEGAAQAQYSGTAIGGSFGGKVFWTGQAEQEASPS